MKRKLFLLSFIILTIPNQCLLAQNFKGIFSFSNKDSSGYIVFKDSTFKLFTLKQNPGSSLFEINDFGRGKYSFDNNKFSIMYDTDIDLNDYSKDSIEIVFASNQNEKNRIFKFHFSIGGNPLYNGNVIISTNTNKYNYPLNSASSIFTVPSSSFITSIKLYVVGFDARNLPFDNKYNVFQYNYILKDSSSFITFISAHKKVYSFKSQKSDKIYFFDQSFALQKADEELNIFLKSIASYNKQVKEIIE